MKTVLRKILRKSVRKSSEIELAVVKKETFHDVKKFESLDGKVTTKITNFSKAANERSINVRNKIFEGTEYTRRKT